jgi:hypothetical protein
MYKRKLFAASLQHVIVKNLLNTIETRHSRRNNLNA